MAAVLAGKKDLLTVELLVEWTAPLSEYMTAVSWDLNLAVLKAAWLVAVMAVQTADLMAHSKAVSAAEKWDVYLVANLAQL